MYNVEKMHIFCFLLYLLITHPFQMINKCMANEITIANCAFLLQIALLKLFLHAQHLTKLLGCLLIMSGYLKNFSNLIHALVHSQTLQIILYTTAGMTTSRYKSNFIILQLKTYKYLPHSKIKSKFYRHGFKHCVVSEQLRDVSFLLCLPSLSIHNIIILLPCGPLNSLNVLFLVCFLFMF